MAGMDELLDDLVAEQRYLDAALAATTEDVWERPTPCDGWLVRDVIAHLAEVDDGATAVAAGAPQYAGSRERSADGTRSSGQDRARYMSRGFSWSTGGAPRATVWMRRCDRSTRRRACPGRARR